MASAVASILTGGALTGVSKIIDSIRGKSPEDAAKLAQTAADLEALRIKYAGDFQLAQINQDVQLNQIAGANIQTEAKAGWLQSLARPSVIWMGNVTILWNFVVRPMFKGGTLAPATLPDMFWWVWCACVLGYVVSRTGQDVLNTALSGQGGSAKLMGMSLDSKGDR